MITNNNTWWHGVVENNIDTEYKLGRVQVRIFGYHSPENIAGGLIQLKTENLPWASILQPTTSASINGIGNSPTGILNGTWVTGYFRDDLKQEPIITGTLIGFSNKVNENYTKVFTDPENIYPLSDHLNEQGTNRLARNDFDDDGSVDLSGLSLTENDEEPHKKLARHKVLIDKADSRTLEIKIPIFEYQGSNPVYDEPLQSYFTQYPHNQVFESNHVAGAVGIIREMDSTPEKERIHEYHPSGTFYEVRPDGSKITKVIGEDFEIVLNGKNLSVTGNLNITVVGDANMYVEGNVLQQVTGNVEQNVEGKAHVQVQESVVVDCQTITANVREHAEINCETMTSNVTEHAEINCETMTSNVTEHAEINATTVLVNTSDTVDVVAGGNITLTTPHGDNVFNTNGSVNFSTGAKVTPIGDVITNIGISLNTHTHIGNLGSPTSPPIL